MVALCIFLSFRQRIQSYLIKKTMQLYLIKETINTTNHTCYHSQRIQLNFLFGARDASRWKETFFIIFSTESSVAFVTRFTWDFSSPSSLLVLRCWLPLWFFVYLFFICWLLLLLLYSPRAESARAVTGRQCPHSGEGEDFLMGQLNFFTKTAVTPERKVEKSIPRWEINRHAEG